MRASSRTDEMASCLSSSLGKEGGREGKRGGREARKCKGGKKQKGDERKKL